MTRVDDPRLAILVIAVLLTIPATLGTLAPAADAQVHYREDGSPWNRHADRGPDAAVDGWYYNLGVTGLRVELVADAPRVLVVRHVLADSPAEGLVQPGDRIVGAGGCAFETDHRNGYGMDRFGADGPIADFARVLDARLATGEPLGLALEREGVTRKVTIDLEDHRGTFAKSFPADCPFSDRVRRELLDYLVEHQREDGSWGSVPQDTFAPLALLAARGHEGDNDERDAEADERYRRALERSVRWHARTTSAEDESWLINWRYCAAAIVLSEYLLADPDDAERAWVVAELREIRDFLLSSQYTDTEQINPRARETHPHSFPENEMDAHGGWGHNPGFEGYGPIAMITAQGALALALMSRCDVEIERARLDAAYAFLARATGANGYVWYADEPAGAHDWADMGRTGAAAVATLLSPYDEAIYPERALAHARVIGEHPRSFPDTHGSPLMGMGYTALGAAGDPASFRRLMDANRWWFVLARCPDGSYYYQPNRDNAGYGADSRVKASAATALILSIPRRNLVVTGSRRTAEGD